MAYKTDLSDAEWDLIKKDFEPASKRGNGHKHDKKSIVNAILYIVKGGIQWRLRGSRYFCERFFRASC